MLRLAEYIIAAQIAAAQLNAAASKFVGVQFKARMSWGWKPYDTGKKSDLRVDCVPWMYESSELGSNDRAGYECSIEVFVQRQFGPEELEQGEIPEQTINRFATLVQEFDVFFKENRSPHHELGPQVKWLESKIVVGCSRPHLEKHLFRGVVKATASCPKGLVRLS